MDKNFTSNKSNGVWRSQIDMDQISEEYIILFQNVCMAMQGLQVILKAGLRFVNGERGEHFVATFGKWCFPDLKHKKHLLKNKLRRSTKLRFS